MKKGKLYLIPSAIAPESRDKIFTPQLAEVLKSTRHFVVEHAREARRFISSMKLDISIEELNFTELDKHHQADNFEKLLRPALDGNNMGLMSDAGCPGVADPGSELVGMAHKLGLQVVPLVGPSSILLGLMGSGLSGQNFRFNGYLPIDAKDLKNKIAELEQHSNKYDETQIFIETPYRSDKMMQALVQFLAPSTQLTVACGLNGENESIITRRVADWQKVMPKIGKIPTVFLFLG